MSFRDYKNFRADNYYHIFNRGNNKMPIFLDQQDFEVFLHRFGSALGVEDKLETLPYSRVRIKPFPAGSFSVLCYCLMTNHFHFLVRQNTNAPIDRLISKVCTSYAKFFNLKYCHSGHVFQGAFKARLVDSESYLLRLSAYIHHNPPRPLTYPYSTLSVYLGKRKDPLSDISFIPKFFGTVDNYLEFFNNSKKNKENLEIN